MDLKLTRNQKLGVLHGKLYQHLIASEAFKSEFKTTCYLFEHFPTTKTYYRTAHVRPCIRGGIYKWRVLSYRWSLAKMGVWTVRYFQTKMGNAHWRSTLRDWLRDYTDFELISAISTMEKLSEDLSAWNHNTNLLLGWSTQPSLNYEDFSLTLYSFMTLERGQLAVKQGKWTEENFIKPYSSSPETVGRQLCFRSCQLISHSIN